MSAAREPEVHAPSPALEPPPGNPRFPLFDGLRGIAVLAVLLLHSVEFSGRVGLGVGGRFGEALGELGVNVFFVISGFLLYRPFVKARVERRPFPSIVRYARGRALRILPAYWVVLTLLAVFPAVTGAFTGHWWRYYGYLQVYFVGATSTGIPVAWTLCVEMSFYIALPIWAAALSRRANRSPRRPVATELLALGALAGTGLLVQILALRHNIAPLFGSALPGEMLWFAVGMALAVLSVAERALARRPPLVDTLCERAVVSWGIAAIAIAVLMATVPAGGIFGLIALAQQPQSASSTLLRLVLQAIAVVGIVLPAVFGASRPGIVRRLIGWQPFVQLGVISYSFYLWHLTILEFIALGHTSAYSATGLNLMAHVRSARATVLFLITLLAAGAIAWLSYRLIEAPFLRAKARTGPRSGTGARPLVDRRILSRQ